MWVRHVGGACRLGRGASRALAEHAGEACGHGIRDRAGMQGMVGTRGRAGRGGQVGGMLCY